MTITSSLLALITLLITAAIGVKRGWGREVITTAIVLGTLLFLIVGGDRFITGLFVGASSPVDANSCLGTALANATRTVSGLIFGGMTLLGYYAGRWHGQRPASGNHRVAGAVAGLVTGGAIVYYVSRNLFPGGQLLLQMPDSSTPLASLPMILGIGLVALVAILFIAKQGNKTSKAH
ncbi:MAG TPA: hypothetical protein VGN32_04680 [Ktedonobacterales bacterium]|jgi:hypothetical protein|nr:hypothetical protein [Ktedonobacterales bacterium]